jgi:concentrative nucleoside transporter, CNT family
MTIHRFIPLLGLVVLLVIAWGLSSHRNRFPWRITLAGLAMQLVFALLVLRVEPARLVFEQIGLVFSNLLNCVDEGASFVFGSGKVATPGGFAPETPAFQVHYFAFKVLPTVIFFSSLMSVLYYIGIMQLVVGGIARLMQWTLGTSGAETLSTAGNIFVGQTEAPLLVRPYLNRMTDSEIMTVMVGGFATIAGGVMAAFIGMGFDATHLLSASLMSAPAALVIAKIMQPEVDVPETAGKVEVTPPTEATNIVDAAANGATDGLKLALNIAAMLIAFLALIAMCDGLLGSVTGWLGYRITFTQIFGYVSAPFAFLMGIETKDCFEAGEVLSKRILGNEFIAYTDIPNHKDFSERTKVILTYALCGFASFGSIAIQIGGLGTVAPDRRVVLVRLGLRAMVGGLLACYMTACLASLLLP